jgi:biopolymer transport protein ExbB/TolQ
MLALALATLAAGVTHAVRAERATLIWAVILVVATPIIGVLVTVVGLQRSFDAIANVRAAERQSHLSLGISAAMSATVIGLGVVPPWIAAFIVGEVRRSRRVR